MPLSKICWLGILIILSCRPLKNSKCRQRLSLSFIYLPQDKTSKTDSIVISPLQVWTPHPDKFCQTFFFSHLFF